MKRHSPARKSSHFRQQLSVFLSRQRGPHGLSRALREIRAGKKRTHWIWWVLPTPARAQMSTRSRAFAINSDAHARAFLTYSPTSAGTPLHENLLSFLKAVLAQINGTRGTTTTVALLGTVDARKLMMSLALWKRVSAVVVDAADIAETVSQLIETIHTNEGVDPIPLDFNFFNVTLKKTSLQKSVPVTTNAVSPAAAARTTLAAHHKAMNMIIESERKKARNSHRRGSTKKRGDMNMPSEIASGIFLGNISMAKDVRMLTELGITHILNCAPSVVHTSKAWYQRRGLASLKQFASADAQDFPGAHILQHHLSKTLRLFQLFYSDRMAQAADADSACNGESTLYTPKLFVHCYAGCNRSATLALAAIMQTQREKLLDVVKRAVRARPCILSNQSFRRELIDLASREGLLADL